MKKTITKLSAAETKTLLETIQKRFEKNTQRHKGLKWKDVEQRLQRSPEKLASLKQMEETGGEPDVVSFDKNSTEYIFMDCSPESPSGRRSTAYDYEGQESRKENKPKNNAVDMASDMGIELLDEEQYRYLQTLGTFDSKTSSWIKTPADIRELDGALFCDYRYGHVFVYHNGAQSYYAARGFRGALRV